MERGGGALCWEMVCLSDDHDDHDDHDDDDNVDAADYTTDVRSKGVGCNARYQYEWDKAAQEQKLKMKMLICKSQNMQKSLTES